MAEQRVAALLIDVAHPIFAGHFPGEPIVPGVMLLEWVVRETAATVGRDAERLRIREAKFFEPLKPAQEAELYLDASPTRCAFRIRSAARDLASGSVDWE